LTEIEESLGKLADEINTEHRRCEEAVSSALEHAIRAGELLAQAKESVPHGSWGTWLAEHFEGSERTAQAYTRLYRRRDEIRSTVADLSVRGALAVLAAPSSSEPFYEVLGFIEKEGRQLASIPDVERLEPSAEKAQELLRAEARMIEGLRQQGEGLLEIAAAVREIWERYDHGKAAGWLREALIGMCTGGPYGHGYRTALWEARYRLSEAVAHEGFRRRIDERLDEGTVTIDLTKEEAILLQEIDPSMLEAVEEAWEEDKEYEQALRKMETFTCPIDVPPSREHGGFVDRLTDEQMRTPFDQLRALGVL